MFNNISLIVVSFVLILVYFVRTRGKTVEKLSPSMTNAVKGICAVCILLGHIANPCFQFFHELSGLIVGCFLL